MFTCILLQSIFTNPVSFHVFKKRLILRLSSVTPALKTKIQCQDIVWHLVLCCIVFQSRHVSFSFKFIFSPHSFPLSQLSSLHAKTQITGTVTSFFLTNRTRFLLWYFIKSFRLEKASKIIWSKLW